MRFLLPVTAGLLLAMLGINAPLAQDAPEPAPGEQPANPDEAPAKPADNRTTTVDFEYDGLVFVQTKVNGKGPYKFLFDSGASTCVLNERLAKKLELELHDMPGGVQGVGTAEASLVVIDSVEIGTFKKGKSIAAAMNLDHMSGTLGYHMMGIIGQNVIKTMEKVEIDFSTSQLSITSFPPGEAPTDWQEETIIPMLEGGGMPGIPGMPGNPPKPPEPEKPKKKEPREEEFSAGPWHAWLLQDADEKKTEAAPAHRSPTESNSIAYTSGELEVPFVGKVELISLWYVDVVLNGQKHKFMLDTGASMLLVVGSKAAKSLAVPESFSFPVKGIGKKDVVSGVIDKFEAGNLTETDLPCSILDMPSIVEPILEPVRNLLRSLGPFGALFLPLLDQVGSGVDFDGIVGLPLATRYKKIIVETRTRKIEFVPYGEDEQNKLEPYSTEDFVKEAVIRTWQGKASTFGLDGDAVPLEDWKAAGLENGGLKVSEVNKDGPAEKAGLKAGDIITHIVGIADEVPEDLEDADVDGKDVRVRDLPTLIMWACTEDPGTDVKLRVRRGDEQVELTVTLREYGWKGTFPERFK